VKKVLLWLRGFQGTTAIEYSLIVGAIAVAISVAVLTLGSDVLLKLFQNIGTTAASFN